MSNRLFWVVFFSWSPIKLIEIKRFIYLQSMIFACKLNNGNMDESISFLDVIVAFRVKIISCINFHIQLSSKASQLACLPQTRSSICPFLENFIWNWTNVCRDSSNRIFLGMVDTSKVNSPHIWIPLIESVDHLKSIDSDQKVIRIKINDNVVFITMVSNTYIPIFQGEQSLLIVYLSHLYIPSILCNEGLLLIYQLCVHAIVN